jgi:hypothetical protein
MPPPSLLGAAQLSATWPLSGIPVTLVGAAGRDGGVEDGTATRTSSKFTVFAPSFQIWSFWRFAVRV